MMLRRHAQHFNLQASSASTFACLLLQSTAHTRHTALGGRRSTLGALRSWRAHLPPRWRFWRLGWHW